MGDCSIEQSLGPTLVAGSAAFARQFGGGGSTCESAVTLPCHDESDNDEEEENMEICVVDDKFENEIENTESDRNGEAENIESLEVQTSVQETLEEKSDETEESNNDMIQAERSETPTNTTEPSNQSEHLNTSNHSEPLNISSDIAKENREITTMVGPMVATHDLDEIEPGEIVHSSRFTSHSNRSHGTHSNQSSLQLVIKPPQLYNVNCENTTNCSTETELQLSQTRDAESHVTRESPSPVRTVSPGEITPDRGPSLHGGIIQPKVAHPLLSYLYYPGGLLGSTLPYSLETLQERGSESSGAHFPRLPTHLPPLSGGKYPFPHPALLHEAGESNIAMPSPLSLAGYPPFWYQYYSALSQSNTDSVLQALHPINLASHSSASSAGPIFPSKTSLSSLPHKISPYTLPSHFKNLHAESLTSPIAAQLAHHHTELQLQLKRQEEERRAQLSPARRSPDSSCSPTQSAQAQRRNGSQLQSMQNMVHGLEREQQQIVTNSLTKLEA